MARLLGGAAVLGVVGGVVLERARAPAEPMRQAEAVVDQTMPLGAPVRHPTGDMMAPDPASLRGIPSYPGASPRRLLGARPGRGLNAISWFSTPDSVDRVLSHYEDAYARADIVYVTHRWGTHRGYVSWFESTAPRDDGGYRDTTEGVLHMVSASREGSQTMVFFSATEPEKLFFDSPSLPLGVRLPPGAKPQVFDLGEVGQQRATIFAQYERSSRETTAGELTRTLQEGGWKVEDRATAPDGQVTLVARQGRRVQTVTVSGTDRRADVLVTVEEQPASSVSRTGGAR